MTILQAIINCKPLNTGYLRTGNGGVGVPLEILEEQTANKNPRSSGSTRRSGRPACTGYPPAANCTSGRSGSDAPQKANTPNPPALFEHRSLRKSASEDSSSQHQFSTSLSSRNASKKIPLTQAVRYDKTKRGDTRLIAAHQQSGTAPSKRATERSQPRAAH
jgi:hypothetical protein